MYSIKIIHVHTKSVPSIKRDLKRERERGGGGGETGRQKDR